MVKPALGDWFWLNGVGPIRLFKHTREAIMIFRSHKTANDIYSSDDHIKVLDRRRFDAYKADCLEKKIELDFSPIENWLDTRKVTATE
ncbi:MAG: hypothetical protein MN733_20570 [Nitrososphaera sp.]|nr:hypothetical protein [Nitrososphaera sp.]